MEEVLHDVESRREASFESEYLYEERNDMTKGKLIIIEAGDGSGKATQTR